MTSEHFDVDFFATAHRDGETGVVVAMEEAKRGSFGGCDENGDCPGCKFEEGGGTLLLHVGVGREIFKWQHVVSGQADNTVRIDSTREFATGAQSHLQRLGGLVVGDHDDDWLLSGAGEKRNVQRTSSHW